jgi:hypothetical protein
MVLAFANRVAEGFAGMRHDKIQMPGPGTTASPVTMFTSGSRKRKCQREERNTGDPGEGIAAPDPAVCR